MAVRLINLHRQPLRIDLRGGGVLMLAAGQRSDVLLEELLYDNCYLAEWERAGWIRRVAARLTDARAAAPPAAGAVARPGPGAAAASAPAKKKAAAAGSAKEAPEAARERPPARRGNRAEE